MRKKPEKKKERKENMEGKTGKKQGKKLGKEWRLGGLNLRLSAWKITTLTLEQWFLSLLFIC